MLSTLKKIKQGIGLNSDGLERPLEGVTFELRVILKYGEWVFQGEESASDKGPKN